MKTNQPQRLATYGLTDTAPTQPKTARASRDLRGSAQVNSEIPAEGVDEENTTDDMDLGHVDRAVRSAAGGLIRRGAPAPYADLVQEGWLLAMSLPHLEFGLATAIRRGLQLATARWLAAVSGSERMARKAGEYSHRVSLDDVAEALAHNDNPEKVFLAAEARELAAAAIRAALDEMDGLYRQLAEEVLGIGCEPIDRAKVAAAHGVSVRTVSDAAQRFKARARAAYLEVN